MSPVALLLALFVCRGQESAFAAQDGSGTAEQDRARQLQPNEPLSATLAAEECHFYRVELSAGQYLQLTVEHRGFDAQIGILGPDRRIRARYGRCLSSPTAISLISDVSGNYQLQLCSFESQVVDTPYTVTTGDARSATEEDDIRIAGERAFAVGEQLRAEWRAERSRDAIKKYEEALSHWEAAGSREEEARTLTAIGDVYHPLGKLEETQDHYQRALEISNDIKDLGGQGRAMMGLGAVHFQQGENQEAIELCEGAIARFQKTENKRSCRASSSAQSDGGPIRTDRRPAAVVGVLQQSATVVA